MKVEYGPNLTKGSKINSDIRPKNLDIGPKIKNRFSHKAHIFLTYVQINFWALGRLCVSRSQLCINFGRKIIITALGLDFVLDLSMVAVSLLIFVVLPSFASVLSSALLFISAHIRDLDQSLVCLTLSVSVPFNVSYIKKF